MITQEMIVRIEKVFGFSLRDWQKDYLLGKQLNMQSGIGNGKTFAYVLKLLLSEGKPIKAKKLTKYIDEYPEPRRYSLWFRDYCMDINSALVENGFKTRLVVDPK